MRGASLIIAVVFSAAIHLSFLIALSILAYFTPAGIMGGGGKGGVVVVSLIEEEGGQGPSAQQTASGSKPLKKTETTGAKKEAAKKSPHDKLTLQERNVPSEKSVVTKKEESGEKESAGGEAESVSASEGESGGAGLSAGSGGGMGGGEGGGIGPGVGRGDPVLSAIWLKINRSKYYPWKARRNGWEGTPRVRFIIGEGGEISSIRLVASCGIPELDEAAIETVKRSAPLPHYPKPITFSIRFSLSE